MHVLSSSNSCYEGLFVCGEGDTKLHCLWIPRLYLISQGQAHEGPLPIPYDFLTKFTLRNDGFWGIPSPAHALWRLMTLCHSLWQNGMVANARGYHVRSGRMAHQIAMYYYNLLFINKEFSMDFFRPQMSSPWKVMVTDIYAAFLYELRFSPT